MSSISLNIIEHCYEARTTTATTGFILFRSQLARAWLAVLALYLWFALDDALGSRRVELTVRDPNWRHIT